MARETPRRRARCPGFEEYAHALSRLATLIGAALLSRAGRRMAGRHAGKLALATLAFELWKNRRDARTTTRASAAPSRRRRWSGPGPRS